MRVGIRWYALLTLVTLSLVLLISRPTYAHEKIDAENAYSLTGSVICSGDCERKTADIKREPLLYCTPAPECPWRFTTAMYGWLPNAPAEIKLGRIDVTLPESLGTLLSDLQFTAMLDFEVRKGHFGAYFAPIVMLLKDTEHVQGPLRSHEVVIEEQAYLADLGLSYEIGCWHMCGNSDFPTVTVEPFAGARWLIDDIEIDINPGRTVSPEVTFFAPVIGLRTFWDLTTRWNLRIEGDYGGFNVDNLKTTWDALGVIGYRYRPTECLTVNVFAGYRYLYIDYKKVAELKVSVRGPLIGVALHFD